LQFDISSKNRFASRIWQGHPGEYAYSMVQSKENRVKPSQASRQVGGRLRKLLVQSVFSVSARGAAGNRVLIEYIRSNSGSKSTIHGLLQRIHMIEQKF